MNNAYHLEILFEKEKSDNFQFELRLLGETYSGGIENGRKILSMHKLSDTIKGVLDQKNLDPDKGWTAPLITDTICFVKRAKKR